MDKEFHSELYPTPFEVLDIMGLDCSNKIVLDPHAGTGNILDYALLNGARRVLGVEINSLCQGILKDKEHELIGEDFLQIKAEQISHVDAIYMNPPFSNADKHILHAWEIAPEGCEIIALCNWETIEKEYMYRRLAVLLRTDGITENLGDVFSTAERTTGIDIGLIKLYKPIVSEDFDYDGFFMEEDEEEQQAEGMQEFNEVRAVVNRYVAVMKSFDILKDQISYMNSLLLGKSGLSLNLGYEKSVTTKETFSKIVQKDSWNYIFAKLNMQKYVTSGVMKDINKFIETQEKVPFTMRNIYRMLSIIVGTRQNTYNKALLEAVDNFTRHTHENRFNVEGWKTNEAHMLGKKFIVNGIAEQAYRYENGLNVKYSTYTTDKIDDLVKVMCSLTGKNYDHIQSVYRIKDHLREKPQVYGEPDFIIEPNTWYTWGFFEVKFFRKGTAHFKFKNVEDWYILNRAYGELKGFSLPETYKKKK